MRIIIVLTYFIVFQAYSNCNPRNVLEYKIWKDIYSKTDELWKTILVDSLNGDERKIADSLWCSNPKNILLASRDQLIEDNFNLSAFLFALGKEKYNLWLKDHKDENITAAALFRTEIFYLSKAQERYNLSNLTNYKYILNQANEYWNKNRRNSCIDEAGWKNKRFKKNKTYIRLIKYIDKNIDNLESKRKEMREKDEAIFSKCL